MAKNIRRMLAMVLVMCMFVSALPMQALAAEGDFEFTQTNTFTGDEVVVDTVDNGNGSISIDVSGTNESGAVLDIAGESKSETSEFVDTNNNSSTEKVATETVLGGTETSGDAEKQVAYQENTTYTKETAADGTTTEKTIVDGLETKEWTENEVEVGQEVPSVEVQLKPGETNSNNGTGTYTEENDHVEGGSTETNSDMTTTTTTVDRVVEGTLSEGGVTVNKTESSLTGSVAPEDYDDKHYNSAAGKQTNEKGNYRDFDGLIADTKPDYGTDMSTKPTDPAYNFQLSGYGDATDAASPVFMNIVFVKDADGKPVKDENGEYIIDWEASSYVNAGYIAGESGMNSQTLQICLKDENGNIFYTYCIDHDTPTQGEHWYKIANLEDNDYYSEEAAAKIRAVVQNGYWGTESDTGSVEKLKSMLTEYAQTNPTVTVTNENGEAVTYNVSELIDGLKEHEALAVTQAAVWSYANGCADTLDGQDGVGVVGVYSTIKYYNSDWSSALKQYDRDYDLESDARMAALYDALMSMEGIDAEDAPTTIINEKHNVGDMYLAVNEKVAENGDKDVYSVDLKFSLDFELNTEDSLKVRLTDAEGNNIKDANGNDIVIEKDLAVKGSERDDGTALVADENGVYTLTGLQLSEGTDFSFNLTLEGTQEIENGVYVYQAYGDRSASQTLVGLASGSQNVEVSVNNTLSFQVEERTHFEEERVWHREFDPVITPPEEPEETPEVPEETPDEPEETPEEPNGNEPAPASAEAEPAPAVFRVNNQDEAVVEIPEEPVPLAAPVITGDNSGIWVAVILMSIFAMVAINLFDRKRQYENF